MDKKKYLFAVLFGLALPALSCGDKHVVVEPIYPHATPVWANGDAAVGGLLESVRAAEARAPSPVRADEVRADVSVFVPAGGAGTGEESREEVGIYGRHSVFDAIFSEDLDWLRAHPHSVASSIHEFYPLGRHPTLLHLATSAEMVAVLVDLGADPIALDWMNYTPLLSAIEMIPEIFTETPLLESNFGAPMVLDSLDGTAAVVELPDMRRAQQERHRELLYALARAEMAANGDAGAWRVYIALSKIPEIPIEIRQHIVDIFKPTEG